MMPLQRITEYDTILKVGFAQRHLVTFKQELHALTSWTISDNAALREVSVFFTTLNLEVTAEKERAQKTLRALNIVSNLRIDATPSAVDKKNKMKTKNEEERKRLGLVILCSPSLPDPPYNPFIPQFSNFQSLKNRII
jgi:hypothetical protein